MIPKAEYNVGLTIAQHTLATKLTRLWRQGDIGDFSRWNFDKPKVSKCLFNKSFLRLLAQGPALRLRATGRHKRRRSHNCRVSFCLGGLALFNHPSETSSV